MSDYNKYYKLQSIMKDDVNQVKHDSKLLFFSSTCLSVTFMHQDQQRDLLMVVPLQIHL